MGRITDMAKTGRFNPRSEFMTWPKEVVTCFEGILDEQARMVFDTLDGGRQRAWMELYDAHATATTDDGDDKSPKNKTPGGILRTNGIDDISNHANLYKQLSRMNHSCSPNVIRMATDNHGGVAVVAKVDIDEGEEVLINYMDDGQDDD